jgi:hypothetical protein
VPADGSLYVRQCDARPTDGGAIVQYLDGGLVWVSAAAK